MSLFKRIIARYQAIRDYRKKLAEYAKAESKAMRWHKSVKPIRKSRQEWMNGVLQGRR